MEVIRKISGINLLQMYVRNGNQYKFWFDSWKWTNTCARVLYISYKRKKIEEGLPIIVDYPNSLKVVCEFWDVKNRKIRHIGEIKFPLNKELYTFWELKQQPSTTE